MTRPFFIAMMFAVAMCARLAGKNLLDNDDFEEGPASWEMVRGSEIEEHGGYNGSRGLHVWRTDEKEYDFVRQPVQLETGRTYRLTAWVKAEDCKETVACIAVEYFDESGKYLAGNYNWSPEGTFDWTRREVVARPPEGTDHCRVALYLERGGTGQAWFDAVGLTPFDCPPELFIVHPLQGQMRTSGESVRLAVHCLDGILPEGYPDGWRVRLHVVSASGEAVREAAMKAGGVRLALDDLPAGEVTLRAELCNAAGETVSRAERTLLALTPEQRRDAAPAGACVIDERGRAIVDGRPFLPIGLFNWEFSNPDDLARLVASPFNCFMPYYSIGLTLPRQNHPPLNYAKIRALLDVLHRNGKKVIFCIKDFYPGVGSLDYLRRFVRDKWEPEFVDMDGLVAGLVTELRDHPALLAWYVNDEIRLSRVSMVNARREQVNRLDPWHPTWGVLCHLDEMPFFDHAHDVVGVDAYPLERIDRPRTQRSVATSMDAVAESGLAACWAVPQLFNWGNYRTGANQPERYREYINPSEEEMRSMTLLMAIRGAKGFVFYCDHDLKRPYFVCNPPLEPPEVFANRWHDVVEVATLLQRLAPFLLSDHDSEPVEAELLRGEAELREFTDDDGRRCILVSAIGPGPVAVRFKPKVSGMRSLYGRSREQADGSWLFEGEDLASDVLLGK